MPVQIMEVAKYVLHRVIIWLFDIQCSSESTRRVDDLQEVTFCYHRPRLMTETMPFVFPCLITVAFLCPDEHWAPIVNKAHEQYIMPDLMRRHLSDEHL